MGFVLWVLNHPELETRAGNSDQNKAEQSKCELPGDAACFSAQRLVTHVRELRRGALKEGYCARYTFVGRTYRCWS